MSKWDGKFNGTYETSRYADRPLEDDILDAGRGVYAYEGEDGGLIRESGTKFDYWFEGDGNGNYDHGYYNNPDDYGMAPPNRH